MIEYPDRDKADEFLEWWERAYDIVQEGIDRGLVWQGCATHDSYATDFEGELLLDGHDPCVWLLRVMDPRQRLEDTWPTWDQQPSA